MGGNIGPIMIGVEGTGLDAAERELLRHPCVGGVILFSRNFESVSQLIALTREIHEFRDPPLLIAIDQEGGRVQRLREGFTPLPPLAVFGRIHARSPERAASLAETCGWLMAMEMRSVGIDLSFAPVLDLDRGVSGVIGDRAFAAGPELVAALASRYVSGMRRAGMAATGKHYPGHGSVAEDSHLALPVDPRPLECIEAEDLVPFARLAREGLEAMMVAHVRYSAVDDRLAGFSPFWLQEVLRGRLGFDGAIISDDLLMAAADVAGDVPERAVAALDAGCDMVLVCRGLEPAAAAADGIAGRAQPPAAAARLARLRPLEACPGRDELQKLAAWRDAAMVAAELSEMQA
jgi:beta-N-acetylhexosaminidase